MKRQEVLEEIRKIILREYPKSTTYAYNFPVGKDEFDPAYSIAFEIIVDDDNLDTQEAEKKIDDYMDDITIAVDYDYIIYPSVITKKEWENNRRHQDFILVQGEGVKLC
jgi:hypothetical protein